MVFGDDRQAGSLEAFEKWIIEGELDLTSQITRIEMQVPMWDRRKERQVPASHPGEIQAPHSHIKIIRKELRAFSYGTRVLGVISPLSSPVPKT